ncbi:hypothetical protein BGZ82_009467 [Podila clonocystis]|nr:hypothetical protein BGZ82_009467 [Podila clonocystis]
MSAADTNSVSHFYYYDDDFGSESDLSISSRSGHFTLPWLTKEPSNTDDTDDTDNTNDGRPKVLIVGAGSGISIGATFRGLFEQLGILEEFKALGKPMIGLDVFSEDGKPLFHVDASERARLCGTNEYIVSRPELYNLLLKQIPPEYIHMGKKVLWFNQDEDGVTIRTWDKKYHHGDILVGADGSYSAVRQNMYKSLKGKGSLPPSDDTSLPFDHVCLLGQTEVLNQEDFPELNKPYSKFNSTLGIERAYASLNKVSAKANDSFRASELGPEAAQAMCKEVRNFKIPGGRDSKDLTLGVLIDKTPKELISKVMLEEKLFDTWHAGRTVLMGDVGGAGAMTAIQDAVALANWISTLQAATLPDIEAIFKEYKAERYPAAKQAVATTQLFKGVGEKLCYLVQDSYTSLTLLDELRDFKVPGGKYGRIPSGLGNFDCIIPLSTFRHPSGIYTRVTDIPMVNAEYPPGLEIDGDAQGEEEDHEEYARQQHHHKDHHMHHHSYSRAYSSVNHQHHRQMNPNTNAMMGPLPGQHRV